MAQKLLLNVLVQVLGEFVEGLSEENLKLGVWSGKIVLQNLELNRASIQKLNLPVSVANGSVKRVEIIIPWTHLESQPVKIDLSGIYLQVGPVVVSHLDPADVSARALENKRHKLEAFEKLALPDDDDKNGNSRTYFQRLTAKIIDNLEIRLHNMHIRYEDAQTIPGKVFSAGLTVDSFVVATTDENWVESFVARAESEVAIHKLATMKNLTVYWNADSPVLANQSTTKWQYSMEQLVYSGRNMATEHLDYLLAPPNKLSVKLTHNEHSPESVPKFDIAVESTMVNFHVDRNQYHQIMITKNQFALADRMQRLFLRRPLGRPSRATAKEWWLYAVRRVLNRENVGSQSAWLNFQRCVQYRRRYIDLVVKSKRSIPNPKNPKENITAINTREANEILEIEKLLPLEALTIYRQLAAVEAKRERLQAAIENPPPKAAATSWFGWGKSAAAKAEAEAEEELITMDKIKAELESGYKIDSAPSTQATWRFVLRSSGALNVTTDNEAVARAKMAMTVEAEMTVAGGIQAKFSLDELQMKDQYTPTPLFPYLIKVPSASEGSAKLTISFQSKDGVSRVRVDALPLEIAWNKPCIRKILDIVVVPKLEAVIDSSDPSLLAASLAPKKKKKNEDGEMYFTFEADAPKILLPDDCSSDCGFLYLDAGHLSVRGEMKGEEGMSWKVALARINAHMPSSLEESRLTSPRAGEVSPGMKSPIKISANKVTSYLIKPFDLNVDCQTLDISEANMTVDVRISPGVKAELDKFKLARVLEFSKLISSTFSNDNDGDSTRGSAASQLESGGSATMDIVSTGMTGSSSPVKTGGASEEEDIAQRYKMIVNVLIPLVSLDLQYDTVNGQHLVVSASQLCTLVRTREYDFQAGFSMNSLSIEDSSRSASQRELAWTHVDSEDENLVSISYASINHKRSPLFNGYGTEVNVAFGSLFMNSDTQTLMHLRPFYEVLLGKRFQATSGSEPSSAQRFTAAAPQKPQPLVPLTTPSFKPRGNHVVCTLGKIRLELLKPKVGDSPYATKNRSDSPDILRARSLSVDRAGSVVHDAVSGTDDLDSVVGLEISGLSTEVHMMDLIEAKVSVHSFEIADTRDISEDYEFRTLFRPDFNLADNLKPSTPGHSSGSNDAVSSPSVGLKQRPPTATTPQSTKSEQKNLLELVYRQHSKQSSVVNIDIGNVTSFFSLDIILELVNISVANSLAVVALVAPVDKDDDDEEERAMAAARSAASAAGGDPPVESSSVMTVCVVAPNMRLILLEDPTIPDTRAVVGRCGIDVKYSRDVATGSTKEINESLHVSLVNAEVFVMMTMVRWNPLQILEPLGIELHHKRSQEKGVVLMTSLALDVDAIDARVSLNDLILAQAIAARGLTNGSAEPPPPQDLSKSTSVASSSSSPLTQITTYNVQLSLGEVTLVVVNDFNGQNLPIVKVGLQGTTFNADGALQNLNGSGSLIVRIDYFNPQVFVWEPILEPWFPSLRLSTGSNGACFDVSQADSESLQLSVTGTMLESFLRTYSLLLQADDTTDRTAAPAVTFQNLLGVPIEILDGDNHLFELRDDAVKTVSRLQALEHSHGSGRMRTAAQSARNFSIVFLDKLKDERQPILNLPVHVNKPHSYQVLPLRPQTRSNTNPVVEEVYEMERYQPLSGSWKAPFMINDPPQWATLNYRPRDIAEIALPSGWEWQGQWTVEVAPQPKKGERADPETDPSGWEYAANFSALSGSSKRRGKAQTFDYVRRRRWIRTRAPSFKQGSDDVRPLTLFWDVQLLATGCRRILIRSGFQIKNTLSFSVLVKLRSNVYNSDFVFGPIESDETFSVPMMYASSTSLSVRSNDNESYQWSQQLQCSQNAVDYERAFDVYCGGTGIESLYFRAAVSQAEKTTSVVLAPVLNFENRLPCKLKYRIVTGLPDRSGAEPVPVEEGVLEAGGTCMLLRINDIEQARISVCSGQLCWSPYIYVVGGRKNRVPIGVPTDKGPVGLYFLMKLERGKDKSEQIVMSSQAALVDRSNLGICVRSVFKDGRELVRPSCSRNGPDSGPSIRFVAVDPKDHELVQVTKLSCRSHRTYAVTTGRHGDFVYVDNNFVWTYLPDYFFGHTCIRTASSDRQLRIKELMDFEVDCRSMVFVLHDSQLDNPPKWIFSGGFHRIMEQAIARHVVNNVVIEHHYAIFGKIVEPGVKIVLGQNSSTASSADMYSVFVLPDIYDKLRDQLLFDNNIKNDDASNSWVSGLNGLSLFNYYNHSISFGISGGDYWSSVMHMKKISSGKGPFEIVDSKTNRAYQLCYSVKAMPGKFHSTNLTTVMPRYCIVNCMDEPIEVRQVGTRRTTYVPSYHTEGWHKAEADKSTLIQIKTNSSVWSFGSVDINEIGSTVFLLPLVDGSNTIQDGDSDIAKEPIVAHVEIKLAESHENCAVTVIIWREEIDSATAYSVRNDSSFPVALQQSSVSFGGARPDQISKFELCVPPGCKIPFGWTDPSASTSVLIAIGKNLLSAGKRAAEISFLETGQALRISSGQNNKEVIMCVTPQGSGKVLHVVDKAEDLSLLKPAPSKKSLNNMVASLIFRRIGISLVLDRPKRREILSFHLKQVVAKLSVTENITSTEVTVDDFQVDNYSETAVYPVMLYCVKPNPKDVEDGDISAFKFCVVKVNSGSSTQHYRYLAVRLLPVAVEIDSATLEILADDLLKSLNVVSRDEALATFSPQKWIEEFNAKLLSLEQRKQLVDVYRSQISAQGKKMFLENFVLHPMKFHLSFQKTRFPRDRDTNMTDFITAFASVDRMEIMLSSFIVVNAMESATTLKTRITANLMQDVQSQIAHIAGSLSILGSPAGFARNVGNGVQAFLYEPAQGLVQGPQDFVLGIGKGTSSLVSGVVSGALNSTAGVIRNVSSGLSLLSGDAAYIEDRNKNRQQSTRGGLKSGFVGGGESVVSGFKSGVTGLFTKPFEEAQKDGALGFVRGVGMGVFGAAVKPVIGVTDGITHMAQGISNELSDSVERKHFRPPRAFARSEADPTELILTRFDASAAYCQAFVIQKAARVNIEDTFVGVVLLDKKQETRVILSEKFLYWNVSRERLWSRPWTSISHCTLIPPQTVGIITYESAGTNSSVPITCKNVTIAAELYEALARNAFRMGNPGGVISTDAVFSARSVAGGSMRSGDASPSSFFNGYNFGTANAGPAWPLPGSATLTSQEIFQRALERLCAVSSDDWAEVDRACWSVVNEWDRGHTGLRAARCCLLLLINKSMEPIQISRTQLMEGKGIHTFPGAGYSEDSKSVDIGGFVVFFGVAPASPMDSGNITFSVNTSAADIVMSSKLSAASCDNIHGTHGGFLEKSVSDWWSKYVICITK